MDANGDSYERLGAICARYGLKLDHVDPEILGRMRLLAETTETVRDCERAAELAEEVFRHYDAFKPRERFSAQERSTVLRRSLPLGCPTARSAILRARARSGHEHAAVLESPQRLEPADPAR